MLRPPRIHAGQHLQDPLTAALEHEILAEKAATLGRLNRRLDKALAALENHDCAAPASADRQSSAHRDFLLDAAGQALWHVVIHRDICGIPGTERLMKDFQVPQEVRLRMGILRPMQEQDHDR